MADVGSVISSQVDLLWSVALALLVAEIFILSRFFVGHLGSLGCLSTGLLIISLGGLIVSMFFGYLTYGAVVEMVRRAEEGGNPQQSFDDAAFSAVIQFAGFAVGLLSFICVFALNTEKIGGGIDDARGG